MLALGSLTVWHSKLISRGETSIEGNINKTEAAKYAKQNKIYINPYNFGWKNNWALFLGLNEGRTWFHLIFPSPHKPLGNGLMWKTMYSSDEDETVTEAVFDERNHIYNTQDNLITSVPDHKKK